MLLYDHTHFPKETVANSCCLISLACCSMTRQEGSRSIPNTVAASYHWHVALRHVSPEMVTRITELLPHIISMLLYDFLKKAEINGKKKLLPHIIGLFLLNPVKEDKYMRTICCCLISLACCSMTIKVEET